MGKRCLTVLTDSSFLSLAFQVIPKTTVNLNALFIGILFAVVGVAANGLLDAKSAPWQTFRSSMSQMMMAGSDSQTMEAMVSSADAV